MNTNTGNNTMNKTISIIEEELERVKSFVNNNFDNSAAVNYIVREYRSNLKKHLSVLINDMETFKEPPNVRISYDHHEPYDKFYGITEIISGMRWQIDRLKAANDWCNVNNIGLVEANELMELASQGEVKSDKSLSTIKKLWRFPTEDEVVRTLKHRRLYKKISARRVWLDNHKLIGLTTYMVETKDQDERNKVDCKHFGLVVKNTSKGLEFKSLDGLYTFDDVVEKIQSMNIKTTAAKIRVRKGEKSGVRRSTPKVSNTKFMIDMKYVNFHYAFGNSDSAPVDSRNFAIRGYIAKSAINPIGVKLKDFELNDAGVVNARFYIDSEIKDLGLDIPLRFNTHDYQFIHKYGARMWVKVTGYNSGFDYEASKLEVIERYYDVADKYAIAGSYAKRIVIDNKPNITLDQIEAKYLIGLSKF